MKMLKKLAIVIMVAITIIFTIYGIYSKVFAKYGITGFQKLNSSSNDGRYEWSLELGVRDYVLHVNWACFTFNNIYCIQKGYAYEHDGFDIRYGIEIDGNDATLYKDGWEESNIVATWSCPENNIMAGIVYDGNGWTTGLQLDGDMKSGSASVAQKGVHQYWGTFEKAMNKGTGKSFDFGFSSSSSTGSSCVDDVKKNIENEDIAYKAKIVIMENTKNHNNRQNLIGVKPEEPGTVIEYTNITVTKQWVDNNNSFGTRPTSIKVDLYKDGEYFKSATLDSSNNWTYTFEELEKDYTYDIKEDTSGFTSYESEKVQESETSYKLVNTLLTEVKVVKQWNDVDDLAEFRPLSLDVTLYSNGVSTGKTVTLNAENEWTATFEKLSKYDKNGKEINYKVKEETVEKYEEPVYTKAEDSKGVITWTIENKYVPYYDGYIEITGKVWEDTPNGKNNNINGSYNKENDKDVLLKDITVRLKYIDENGIHRLFNENLPNVYETKTDVNGEYKIVVNYDNSENVYKLYEDITTVNEKLKTAYVEFEYDGMKYTTVNDEMATKTVINEDGSESTVDVPSSDQSKAVEDEEDRNNLDSNHSTVTTETAHPDNWTDKNITADTKTITSYEKGEDENREVVVKYCNGNGTCDRTNPEGAWMTIENQPNKYPCENCQKTGHDMATYEITVQKIPNINLGLFEREQPDVAIFADLSKVEVTMNSQKYTYLYGVKGSDNNDVGLQVKFQNKETYTYRRPVNPADIAYLQEEANQNKMSVLVTYEVKVANLSTTLPITVHNIINSFDSEYTLNTSGWTVTDASGFKQATSGDLNISVNPQEESEAIKLTYTVSNVAIRDLLNQEATLNNAVEIGSYSVRYGEGTLYAEQRSGGRTDKPYAGYDYDSHPGNAGIVLNTSTNRLESTKLVEYTSPEGTIKLVPEDDTDIAPSFVLCKDDKPKTLSGTIWEDVDEILDDEERLGNGQYDSDEEKVDNVKVELYNLDGTLAKLYNEETKQLDRDAVAKTVDGTYSLDGVVTGEYYMKFIYGDDTTKLGHAATTMDGETTVNARNYKSTVIKDSIIRDVLSKDYASFSEEDKKWHITHEDGFSVAVDNMKERLEIEHLYHGNYDNKLNMTAYTKPFATQVEFEATGSSNVDDSGNIANVTETLDRLDFGISERPREDLFAQKTITYLKITLANGQILTEGNPNDNISYVKSMGLSQDINSGEEARNALEKQLLVEMDSELIQGAQLELTYSVKITNNNELDYDYGIYEDYKLQFEDESKREYDRYIAQNSKANYYYYGDSSGLTPIQAEIEIADYIDKDLANNEDTTKWVDMENDILITEAVKEAINNNGYKALQGIKNSSTIITLPRGEEHSYEQEMTAVKLLANKEENVYDNNLEILKIDGKTARTIQESDNGVQIKKSYEPGNYEPSLEAGTFEQDDDRVKIMITPPTGIINYITIYVIAGLVGLIAIFAGVIFIKKKVLTK